MSAESVPTRAELERCLSAIAGAAAEVEHAAAAARRLGLSSTSSRLASLAGEVLDRHEEVRELMPYASTEAEEPAPASSSSSSGPDAGELAAGDPARPPAIASRCEECGALLAGGELLRTGQRGERLVPCPSCNHANVFYSAAWLSDEPREVTL